MIEFLLWFILYISFIIPVAMIFRDIFKYGDWLFCLYMGILWPFHYVNIVVYPFEYTCKKFYKLTKYLGGIS